MKRKSMTVGFVLILAMLAVEAAKADTFHASMPGNKVTSKEALKLSVAGKDLFRCRKVMSGPNLNPITVKGSKPSFHTSVGEGIKDAALQLADGKRLYKCEAVEIDAETARVRKATVEE